MIKLLDSTVACLSMSALVKIAMMIMMMMMMTMTTMITMMVMMTMMMEPVLKKTKKKHAFAVCALLVNSN